MSLSPSLNPIFAEALRPFAPASSEVHAIVQAAPAAVPAPVAQPSSSERFIICGGTTIEKWVACDEIFKMDRAATVDWIARGELRDVSQVLAFDLENGTCRDATKEIAADVMTRWADADEFLDEWQYEFVEMHIGVLAARAFVCGRAA